MRATADPPAAVKGAGHDPLRARTCRFHAFSQFTESRSVLLTREAAHAGRLDLGDDVLERLTLSMSNSTFLLHFIA
jgi:hypothetical protein